VREAVDFAGGGLCIKPHMSNPSLTSRKQLELGCGGFIGCVEVGFQAAIDRLVIPALLSRRRSQSPAR
jgi:hypothetical protein